MEAFCPCLKGDDDPKKRAEQYAAGVPDQASMGGHRAAGGDPFDQGGGGGGLMGMAMMMAGGQAGGGAAPPKDAAAFAKKAAEAIPADIHMFSGCKDEQCSADVYDVSTFGLPKDSGPGGAGGACTNAMMLALHENPNLTWSQLLESMRKILVSKDFEQVPQLSSSKPLDLSQKFDLTPATNRPTKALMIGINYGGQQGELRGCHNDVLMMKQFLEEKGDFGNAEFKLLMDDGEHESPTSANILKGFRWLVAGAKDGDALFMHYSGHGGSMKDDNNDEDDGKDETLVPLDYQSAGQIRDDKIFEEIVTKLPAGVSLKVVMDCCHSGSIFDLPYTFACTEANSHAMQHSIANGGPAQMPPNADFGAKLLKVGMRLFAMKQQGASFSQLGTEAMKMLGTV